VFWHLDSANAGANDADALGANAAEMESVLTTVDRISGSVQFGGQQLLDGAASGGITFQIGANAGQTDGV
jgi:flagellin